jgi:hypothetical protein
MKNSPALGIVLMLLKLLSIVVGLVASLVALMSMVGALTDNGWVRLLVAAVVLMVPPMFLADRLLPDDNSEPAPGLVTDVFSLFFLGVGFLWAVAAHAVSGPFLAREGDRLEAEGFESLAALGYAMAGVRREADPAAPLPDPAASASASASASSSASAPPALSASAPASASSSAAPPASAPPAHTGEAPSRTGDRTPADLFKQLAPSVVTIFVKGRGGEESSGTGFVIDNNGTLATNHHVINRGQTVVIKFHNGARYDAADVLVDVEAVDLALLRIDLDHPAEKSVRSEAAALTLGDSEAVIVGERAISIGNPLGLEHTLTDGLVSARRVYEGRAWIQMSVPVSPGNSGGPLFNLRGEVIGITTQQVLGGMAGRAQNLNLAVPVNELKKLISPTYPTRRKFGEHGAQGRW